MIIHTVTSTPSTVNASETMGEADANTDHAVSPRASNAACVKTAAPTKGTISPASDASTAVTTSTCEPESSGSSLAVTRPVTSAATTAIANA